MAEIKKATFNSKRRAVRGYSFKLQITDTQLSFALRIINLRINQRLAYVDPASMNRITLNFCKIKLFFGMF